MNKLLSKFESHVMHRPKRPSKRTRLVNDGDRMPRLENSASSSHSEPIYRSPVTSFIYLHAPFVEGADSSRVVSSMSAHQFHGIVRTLQACDSWSSRSSRRFKRYWHANLSLSIDCEGVATCVRHGVVRAVTEGSSGRFYRAEVDSDQYVAAAEFPDRLTYDLEEEVSEYIFRYNETAEFYLFETMANGNTVHCLQVRPILEKLLENRAYAIDQCECLIGDVAKFSPE